AKCALIAARDWFKKYRINECDIPLGTLRENFPIASVRKKGDVFCIKIYNGFEMDDLETYDVLQEDIEELYSPGCKYDGNYGEVSSKTIRVWFPVCIRFND